MSPQGVNDLSADWSVLEMHWVSDGEVQHPHWDVPCADGQQWVEGRVQEVDTVGGGRGARGLSSHKKCCNDGLLIPQGLNDWGLSLA